MTERRITIGTAVALVAWVLTLVLLVVLWDTRDDRAGFSAIVVVAVAATATIRTFIVNQCGQLHNAFTLGRDSVQGDDNTIPLRRP